MYRTRYSAAPHEPWLSEYPPSAVHAPACTLLSFYADVLGGDEVSLAVRDGADDAHHFMFEDQLVEVRPSRDDGGDALQLAVTSPLDIAERCWDAGCTVALEGEGLSAVLYVTDPLGRLIRLVPRE